MGLALVKKFIAILAGHSPEEDDEGSRAGHSDSGSVTHRVKSKPSAPKADANGFVKGGGAAIAAGSNLPSHWLEKRRALQVVGIHVQTIVLLAIHARLAGPSAKTGRSARSCAGSLHWNGCIALRAKQSSNTAYGSASPVTSAGCLASLRRGRFSNGW